MKVVDLYIYPIKSCQGIKIKAGEVTQKGFLWDREFMLVDQEGKFLTQRVYPLLATITVKINGDSLSLSTTDNQNSSFELLPTLEGREIKVRVWSDRTTAIDQGDEVAQWFNEALKLSGKNQCRLVRQSNKHIRAVDEKYSFKPNQPVSFADGYPFLLTNTASLDDLNHRLEKKYPDENQQIPMIRFRPNIVVKSDRPFIEDTWKTIKIGQVKFRLVKPCSRCIITTTDQITGERNKLKEPLATLSDFRTFKNQGIMFGQNVLPENLGIIKEGDFAQID